MPESFSLVLRRSSIIFYRAKMYVQILIQLDDAKWDMINN
jgi:hypothetical protein